MRVGLILLCLFIGQNILAAEHYTVLTQQYDYQAVTHNSQQDIKKLLTILKPKQSLQTKLLLISKYFMNRPYQAGVIQAEGDWCSASKHGCVHVQQDPIYRTDMFNCQTLVQTSMALLHAKDMLSFKQQLLRATYGAAGQGQDIHYYNRNNFVSADMNPLYQRYNWFKDSMLQSEFKPYVKTTAANIKRMAWFAKQAQSSKLKDNVRVLQAKDGPAMQQRFSQNYPKPMHIFQDQQVAINYLPMEALFKRQLTDKIPTPAIVEIVRDSKHWQVAGKPIENIIGTELNVSHLGFLYRKHFKNKTLIYQAIRCRKGAKRKTCETKPFYCHHKQGCTRLMLLHASEAFPASCRLSVGGKRVKCNRVQEIPLLKYLNSQQYGHYLYRHNPAILGIHLEELT